MSTPARIVAVIAVLAGVFVLGYVVGARQEVPSSAEEVTTPQSAAEAEVSTSSDELESPIPEARFRNGELSVEASSREVVASTSKAAQPSTYVRPYKGLSREWIHDYGMAIKAVRDPKNNPEGRELDEACLKVLQPMVYDGWRRIVSLEDAERQALDKFMEWKISQGLVADLSQKEAGPKGRRIRSSHSSKNRVTKTTSVFVDPGESPEVDAATRELADARARYEREVREFIASCGR